MTQPEKEGLAPRVMSRLFDRHAYQHSLWAKMLKEEHKNYLLTPLECNGLAAKLALFDDACSFEQVGHRMRLILETITSYMAQEEDPKQRERISWYVRDLNDVIELLNWMRIFGPFPDPK